MRESRTSGSVGGRGRRLPWPTRLDLQESSIQAYRVDVAIKRMHHDNSESRNSNRIVPPPGVPDRASFREIVPPRTSQFQWEADRIPARALARPGFELPGTTLPPERADRSVALASGSSLVDTR